MVGTLSLCPPYEAHRGLICFARKRNLDAQLRIAVRLLRAAASELRSIALEQSEAGAISAGFLRLSV